MAYDYTDAPTARDYGEPIPHGTIATVSMHIRPGGVGEDNILKRNREGSCEMLDIEFTVIDGEYKGRKIWEYWILNGTTDGHAKAAEISRGRLKAALDCALGRKPEDISPEARAARTVSLRQFEGMTIRAKIGVEKGTPKNNGTGESWPDKNILAGIITPDRNDWRPVPQPSPLQAGPAGSAATPPQAAPPITRPGWAS